MFAPVPVGFPGLFAFGLGGVLFFGALALARHRSTRQPASANSRRDPRSIAWIILQAIGIGIAGLGHFAIRPDPWSADSLISGGIVLALMLATVGLFHWSSETMGRNWALVARTRADGSLVTGGPFAYIRNPIYVALALFMVAMAVAYGHVANLVLAAPVYAFATWMRVRSEEAVLRATFGAPYDAYVGRVKRFVPGLF